MGADRLAHRGGTALMQPGVEQARCQQVGRDEYPAPSRCPQQPNDVAHPRYSGGHATEMNLSDLLGQHRCGAEQFTTRDGARGAGGGHHHHIAGPPAHLAQSGVHHVGQHRIGTQRRGDGGVVVSAVGDARRQVRVHVIARGQERRHDDGRSGNVGEQVGRVGAEHVDERRCDRPDPCRHSRRQLADGLQPRGAAGAVRDEDQHSAAPIAKR